MATNETQGKLFDAVTETVAAPALKLSVALSATSTHQQAMKAIDSLCGALHTQEVSIEHTRRVLGKTLAVVQDHRLYEPEFSSFEQFSVSIATRHRVSRATLRDSLFIARRLPDLTTEQAEAISMVNLSLVARAAKDAKPGDVKMLLRDAARMPITEFRTSLQGRGLIASNEADIDTVRVSFILSKATYERWMKLVGERDATTVFIDAVNLLYKEMTPARKPLSNTKSSRERVVGTKVA